MTRKRYPDAAHLCIHLNRTPLYRMNEREAWAHEQMGNEPRKTVELMACTGCGTVFVEEEER